MKFKCLKVYQILSNTYGIRTVPSPPRSERKMNACTATVVVLHYRREVCGDDGTEVFSLRPTVPMHERIRCEFLCRSWSEYF